MFGLGKKSVSLCAPNDGTIVAIEDVDDPTFAGKLLGEGFGIQPSKNAGTISVGAPVAGVVTAVFPTGHAIGIRTAEGLEVLVHCGLDTVNLKGSGFFGTVSKGDTVREGDCHVTMDAALVAAAGFDPIVLVVVTSRDAVARFRVEAQGHCRAGTHVAKVTL